MSDVQVVDEGAIRTITLNRPAKLNALRRDDLAEATRAVRQAPDETRVLVFAGSGGRAFSVGMDVHTFVGIVQDPSTTREVIGAVKLLLDTVRMSQLATIASVDGYCLGAAFELVLACDFRLATPGSSFGLPEINLGLPCILESALLQQYVGLSRAKEIILTGDRYTAEQMAAWGMLNDTVDSDDLAGRTTALAETLAAKPRAGVASQKRLFERWQNEGLQISNEACLEEIEGVFRDPSTKAIVEQVAGTH